MSNSSRKRFAALTPLPRGQVASVLLLQMCESLQINVLFPFLVFMIEDFGYTGNRLGYYAGGLAASFCSAQFISSCFWGRFSDRFGRKLALLLGCVGSAIAVCVFGSSQTYTQAVAGRVISGLLNGNIGVMKSFLTEITDDTNRSYGFSLLSLAWGIGVIIAPLLGGALCYPAQKYPYLFTQHSVFERLPFLLPCLIVMLAQVITAACILFCMRETRPTGGVLASIRSMVTCCRADKLHTRTYETVALDDVDGVQMTKPTESPPSTRSTHTDLSDDTSTLLSQTSDIETPTASTPTPNPNPNLHVNPNPKPDAKTNPSFLTPLVWLTTCNYGVLCMAYIIWEETMPMYFKLDVNKGGLSLGSSGIGVALSLGGISLLLFTLCILPPLERKFGKFWMMLTGLTVCVPLVSLWPIQSLILQRLGSLAMWISLVGGLCLKNVLGSMTFTSVMIFVNHSVSDENLGAVNGLGQSMGAIARAVGPAMGGALWSVSVTFDFVYLNFLISALCLCVSALITYLSPRSLEYKFGTVLEQLLD